MTQLQERAKEAIASALYRMPFCRFLGETDDVFGASVYPVWWGRLQMEPERNRNARNDPRQLMVALRTEKDGGIVAQLSWLNLTGDKPLRGEQKIRISTVGQSEAEVRMATEQLVLAVLDVFQQILGGTGVAGPIEKLAPESNDEIDPENDMAVPE